jgi:NADPH-dependent ferric siderophore reductase
VTTAPQYRQVASGGGLETSALLQRLPGVHAFDLEVADVEMLTPAMRRLTLAADGLDTLEITPGQDLMMAVPADGDQHFRRRYTIRRLLQDVSSVLVDIVLHGDGPGARWAAAVHPGDRVEAIGPRGKVTLAEDARWHLFAGDETAVPATFSMVEALAPGAVAVAVLEASGPEEEQSPDDVRCDLALRWLHRAGEPGTGTALPDALRDLELPAGPGHVYLAGELRQVAAARAVLIERGVSPRDIDHKAYWRLGVANAAHGEPERPTHTS